ncbi:nitrogen assimilation regulator [Saccharibacter sp. 17.LH.SD]|nr:nitrogen assimilation regulator [Saccharibacter sp. 17.LH.SD]
MRHEANFVTRGEAQSSALRTLLLYGTSGIERREVARHLHDHSPYAAGNFVEAHLRAVPRGLRADRLFDSPEKNWIKQAQGGTLLIDEVDCLCPALQKRFVDFLTHNDARVRVIVATRYERSVLLQHGDLEESLYHWLTSLEASQCLGPERIRAIRLLSKGESLGLSALLEPVMRRYITAGLEAGEQNLHAHIVGAVERPLISMVLSHAGGNQLRAAELLGINRNTLRKRIRDFAIVIPKGE